MGPSRVRTALACLLVACATLAACGGEGGPSASPDPRELFIRALDRAMALQSVHVTGRVEFQGAVLGAVSGTTFDADVDFGRGAIHAQGGAPSASPPQFELVVAEGVWYRRDGNGWQRSGGGMIPMPAGDDIRSALSSFATDDRLVVTSTEVTCGARTCHRLVATVPPDVVWERFAPVIRSLIYVPDEQPADLAPVTVEVTADALTSDPVHIEVVTTFGGAPAKLTIDGSAYDLPLSITPPVS